MTLDQRKDSSESDNMLWVYYLLFCHVVGTLADGAQRAFAPPPGACNPDVGETCSVNEEFPFCGPKPMFCTNKTISLCCEPGQIASVGFCWPRKYTRCGDVCCGSTCSHGVCCPSGQFGTDGICCPNATDFNCGGACCTGSCLSGLCCPAGYYLSNGVCCPPTEVCCPPGLELFDGVWCEPGAKLCNGACCIGLCWIHFVSPFPPGANAIMAICLPLLEENWRKSIIVNAKIRWKCIVYRCFKWATIINNVNSNAWLHPFTHLT